MSPRSGHSPAPPANANRFFPLPTPWICAAIFSAALLAYLPALSAGFIWDDNGHVTRADLRSLAGLGRIWFEVGATQQYYPVLHSAFWLEHHVWGEHPFGYHLLNVLLHATSACLFASLLRRLAVPGAALAAFLFALHPVCVESVAWVSEQKNTLSTVLYLCAALAYLRFDRATFAAGAADRHGATTQRSAQSGRLRWYGVASLLFVAALLTKTVTATLPAALWVILWWKHGRLDWRRHVVPLLPWVGLGAACGLFTAHFERVLIGAHGADFALGALDRCVLAGRIFWFYLGKLLWPANLVFNYPRWTIDASDVDQWLWLMAALALVGVVIYAATRKPWGRGVLVGLLLFGGTLFPVLGFFNIYPFRHAYVADHFQYLATLPLVALAGVGFTLLQRRFDPAYPQFVSPPGRSTKARVSLPPAIAPTALARLLRPASHLLPIAGVAVLGALTFSQSRVYRDVFSLYETTLARNPSSWLAHNNLAIALTDAGRVGEAIPHFEAALKLKPDFPQAENNLGDSLTRLGRVDEAIPHFERALQLEPRYPVAHRNLGMALAMAGRTDAAITHFAEAVRLEPTYAEAELYWAVALSQSGRPAEALPHFERVLALLPSSVDAHLGLAEALRQLGRSEEAQQHLQAAQQLGAP